MGVVIFQKRNVQVYQASVPDRNGYRASTWASCLALADLVVSVEDKKILLRLSEVPAGLPNETTFLEGPLKRSMEQAYDSSRAFAIRWRTTSKAVWLGIIFDSREDSMNFQSVLALHHEPPAPSTQASAQASPPGQHSPRKFVDAAVPAPSIPTLDVPPPPPARNRRSKKP
eukprot:Blabericola_migrator_1__4631@NODE_2454_length_2733_cov_303_135409_g1537_i0_p3_GENE_NODE_2454_length_2733_cov_303_135409_g1537_i0NODE_2454_length_2733_cov_303_135409_g1537_i0_p3_ORF_typecomplete_len171_score16_61DUF1681/PF07933_14/1_3e14_NODE_2454_length_2733_cov_303_135409_g1537_i021342646